MNTNENWNKFLDILKSFQAYEVKRGYTPIFCYEKILNPEKPRLIVAIFGEIGDVPFKKMFEIQNPITDKFVESRYDLYRKNSEVWLNEYYMNKDNIKALDQILEDAGKSSEEQKVYNLWDKFFFKYQIYNAPLEFYGRLILDNSAIGFNKIVNSDEVIKSRVYKDISKYFRKDKDLVQKEIYNLLMLIPTETHDEIVYKMFCFNNNRAEIISNISPHFSVTPVSRMLIPWDYNIIEDDNLKNIKILEFIKKVTNLIDPGMEDEYGVRKLMDLCAMMKKNGLLYIDRYTKMFWDYIDNFMEVGIKTLISNNWIRYSNNGFNIDMIQNYDDTSDICILKDGDSRVFLMRRKLLSKECQAFKIKMESLYSSLGSNTKSFFPTVLGGTKSKQIPTGPEIGIMTDPESGIMKTTPTIMMHIPKYDLLYLLLKYQELVDILSDFGEIKLDDIKDETTKTLYKQAIDLNQLIIKSFAGYKEKIKNQELWEDVYSLNKVSEYSEIPKFFWILEKALMSYIKSDTKVDDIKKIFSAMIGTLDFSKFFDKINPSDLEYLISLSDDGTKMKWKIYTKDKTKKLEFELPVMKKMEEKKPEKKTEVKQEEKKKKEALQEVMKKLQEQIIKQQDIGTPEEISKKLALVPVQSQAPGVKPQK